MNAERGGQKEGFGDLGRSLDDVEASRVVHSRRDDIHMVLLHGPKEPVYQVLGALRWGGKTDPVAVVRQLRGESEGAEDVSHGLNNILNALERDQEGMGRLLPFAPQVRTRLSLEKAVRESHQPFTSAEHAVILSAASVDEGSARMREVMSHPTLTQDEVRDVLVHGSVEEVTAILKGVPRKGDTKYELSLAKLRAGETGMTINASVTRLVEAVSKEPELVDLVAAAKLAALEAKRLRLRRREVIRDVNFPLTTGELGRIVADGSQLEGILKGHAVSFEDIRDCLTYGPGELALSLARNAPKTTIESYEGTVSAVRSGTPTRQQRVSFQRLIEAVGREPKLVDRVEAAMPQVREATAAITLRQEIVGSSKVPLTAGELERILSAGSPDEARRRLADVEADPEVSKANIKYALLRGSREFRDAIVAKAPVTTSANYGATLADLQGGSSTSKRTWASFNRLVEAVIRDPELVTLTAHEKRRLQAQGISLEGEGRRRAGRKVKAAEPAAEVEPAARPEASAHDAIPSAAADAISPAAAGGASAAAEAAAAPAQELPGEAASRGAPSPIAAPMQEPLREAEHQPGESAVQAAPPREAAQSRKPHVAAAKPAKTVDVTVPVGELGGEAEFEDAVQRFCNRFSSNMKRILSAAGMEMSPQLKNALRGLPHDRQGMPWMQEVHHQTNRRGDLIVFTAAFLRTQPAETVGKVLRHMEEELVTMMGGNIGFQDVSKIAYYATLAKYAADNGEISKGDGGLQEKAASVSSEYEQTIPDLKMSESVRGEYSSIRYTYERIAKELKGKNA